MRGRYASKLRWVLVLASVLLWTNEPASAQPAVQRGYIFVRAHCSQCHAIDRSGASLHRNGDIVPNIAASISRRRPATTVT